MRQEKNIPFSKCLSSIWKSESSEPIIIGHLLCLCVYVPSCSSLAVGASRQMMFGGCLALSLSFWTFCSSLSNTVVSSSFCWKCSASNRERGICTEINVCLIGGKGIYVLLMWHVPFRCWEEDRYELIQHNTHERCVPRKIFINKLKNVKKFGALITQEITKRDLLSIFKLNILIIGLLPSELKFSGSRSGFKLKEPRAVTLSPLLGSDTATCMDWTL